MATAIAHNNTTASTILRTIEGNAIWSAGPVTFNVVQLDNPDELQAYNAQWPENQGMIADLADYWIDEFALALRLIGDLIPIALEFTDSINATYLVGQQREEGSLGAANTPSNPEEGFRPVIGFDTMAAAHTTEAETGGGSDRFQTIIHEFLHAMGLSHPHDTEGGTTTGTGATPDGESMQAPYQFHQTTLSYTYAPNAPAEGQPGAFSYGRGVTPMALDIAALHRMYGVDMTTRTGNTEYRLTDPGTSALDLDGEDGTIAVGRAYYGIWDAAGTDTISYSGASRVIINLMQTTLSTTPDDATRAMVAQLEALEMFRALPEMTRLEISDPTLSAGGFFSSILTDAGIREPGGFSIARNAIIENAQGGSGDDLLIGNSANNRILGNDGSDAIFGGDGADTLDGGAGDDFIFGGSSAADLRDVIFGGDGNDSIDGGWGNDELHGGNGNDTILGGFGSDTVIGNAGDDLLSGGAGSDLMFGGPGNDTLNGGWGFDRLNGGTGADRFFHAGVADHASDWIQDYSAAEGDVLVFGLAGATRAQFQVNINTTAGAGAADVAEAFVIYRPTGQIMWALVDGDAQDQINILVDGQVFDLMA